MEQSWTFVRGVANTALDGLEAGGLPSTLLRWERRVPAHTAGREWGVGSYWLLGPQETPARWVQGLVTQLPQILLDAPFPEVDLTSDSRRIPPGASRSPSPPVLRPLRPPGACPQVSCPARSLAHAACFSGPSCLPVSLWGRLLLPGSLSRLPTPARCTDLAVVFGHLAGAQHGLGSWSSARGATALSAGLRREEVCGRGGLWGQSGALPRGFWHLMGLQ